MPDAVVLAVAVAVAYLPGLVLLAALSVPPGLLMVALAPAASVAVAGVVAVLVAPVGLPFGPVALLVATVAISVAAVALRRGARRLLPPGTRAPLVVGSAMVAVGAAYAAWAWLAASARSPRARRNTT